MKLGVLLAVIGVVASTAIPKEGKDRVLNQKLSDEEHELENGEHNPDYDHEAFLGEEEAKRFDQLTPEESKEKLGQIYSKIDVDKDGKVTGAELEAWIRLVHRQYIVRDVKQQWQEYGVEGDAIEYAAYDKRMYGFLGDDMEDKDRDTYTRMQARDKRRWDTADRDGDGKLSQDEFGDFLHPEDSPHMQSVVVEETLEDIDKDKDGFVSLEEYIGDMYPNKEGEAEPEWVKTEREQFSGMRDKNSDGRMDKEEVKEWIMPPDYDHADAEAKHLIHEADTDKDGTLSREEVLEHHDVFVGSQATDFGEALTRHDEF